MPRKIRKNCPPSRLRYKDVAAWIGMFLVGLAVVAASGQSPPRDQPPLAQLSSRNRLPQLDSGDKRPAGKAVANTIAPASQDGFRSREGTEIVNQDGFFRQADDRIVFSPSGDNRQFIALENLNLERIAQVVADNPQQVKPLQWSVTGTVTEYRGANYLFVRRANLRAQPTSD